MSLMPEKPLCVSPQLAATIGLEEALLYQLLGEIQWLGGAEDTHICMDCRQLLGMAPFWTVDDLSRILASLQAKGIISRLVPPAGPQSRFSCAIDAEGAAVEPTSSERSVPQPAVSQAPAPAPPRVKSRLMDTRWRPARDVVAQLNQYGIPEAFIEQQIPEFVTYWSERGDPQHSWNAKFLKNTLRLWREEQTQEARRSRESLMVGDWKPSRDAVELLVRQAGISRNFVEDAIPEFILYWRERGVRRSTWNTDFVRHVKLQWARYTATLEHDSEPRVIGRSWQPSEDLFEVLQLANIPRDFAVQQVPEFTLYWRESGQATNSWNTRFLQHVKRQWAKHCASGETSHERHQGDNTAVRTRDRSLVEDLTDRSWAT